jgi:hypothetical protein
MKKFSTLIIAGAISILWMQRAAAFEWPMVAGDYWDVAGIYVKDGGGLKYANFLAGEWRKQQEFAKSKGWLKGYMVFENTSPRAGEPNLYLVSIVESFPSGAETEKREKEFEAWAKKSTEVMESEAGNRAEFREVKDSFVLRELKFRN